MTKTPCGTSTTGVFEYSGDAEIGLKLKIELSSLLSCSLSNLLCELSIFPVSSRYVPFASTCGKRNDVFIFFRWTLEVHDEKQTLECLTLESGRILFSFRIFDLGYITMVVNRIPLMEFSSQIGFSSTYVLDHAENLQQVKLVRE